MIKLQNGGFVSYPIEGWPNATTSVWEISEEIELQTTDINEIMKKCYELIWKEKWKAVIVKGDKFRFEIMDIEVINFMKQEEEDV